MGNFFDELSKNVAIATTRREALRVAGRMVLGGFLTSTGLPKLWSRVTTQLSGGSLAVVACPDCGTCEMCDAVLGQCGLPCSNPCLTSHLCRKAKKYAPYLTLQADLTQRQYVI